MYMQVTFARFAAEFGDRSGQFSPKAKRLIFNYLEESDPDAELDILEVCETFNESTAEELRSLYNIDIDIDADDLSIDEAIIFHLRENTTYLGQTSDGFVYAVF